MNSLWFLVLSVVAGIVLGMVVRPGQRLLKAISIAVLVMLGLLTVSMGFKVAANDMVFDSLPTLGLYSLVLSVSAIIGSVLFTKLIEKLFLKKRPLLRTEEVYSSGSPFIATAGILLGLICGLVMGRISTPSLQTLALAENIVMVCLCLVVFLVGLDAGGNRESFKLIKSSGWALLIAPVGTAIGSVALCMLVAPLLGLGTLWGGAVGAGYGFYTFSGITLTAVNVKLGTIAFLANLFREVLSLVVTPLVGKWFGPYAAIAPGGATSMDTCLQVIIRSVGKEYSIVAFVSGVLLSFAVPVMLSAFIIVI